MKGIYFNLLDISYDMYEEKYKWKVLIKKKINLYIKQKKKKYLCLNIEEKVWNLWEGSLKKSLPLPLKNKKYQKQAL